MTHPLGREVGRQIMAAMHDRINRPLTITKLAASIRVSNEQAGAFPRATEEDHARWAAEREAAQPAFRVALADLEQVTEPWAVALLALHHRDDNRYTPQCRGCDWSGYEGEPPDWPCRTVDVIAEHLGINWPDWTKCDWHVLTEETTQ